MRARAPGRAHTGACQAPRCDAAGRGECGKLCGECPGLGARPRGRTRASTTWSSTASGWAWTRGAWRPCACAATPPGPSTKACLQAAQGGSATSGSVVACSRCLASRPATEGGGAVERPLGARHEHAQPGRRQMCTCFWHRRRPLVCSAPAGGRVAGPGSHARNALHVLSGAASTCFSRVCPPPHGIPTLSSLIGGGPPGHIGEQGTSI